MTSIGSTMTAGYRADGLRGWKQVGTAKTYYLYDQGEPVVELNSAGTVTAVNFFAPDGLVAREQSGSWLDYTFDQQGNVSQRLDGSQNVVSDSIYDSYGVESSSGTAPSDPFGYNARWGYYLDRETGLYLCGHRYYDPASGRWITRDPIGYAGGVNLYGYCGNQPALTDLGGELRVGTGSDPSGFPSIETEEGLEGAAEVGEGTEVIGGSLLAPVAAAAAAAAAGAYVGEKIDQATDGRFSHWWCKVLHVDCDGPDSLPASGFPRITKDEKGCLEILPVNFEGNTGDECDEDYEYMYDKIMKLAVSNATKDELVWQLEEWHSLCHKHRTDK